MRAWLCKCPGRIRHPMHRLATMPRRDAVPAVAFPVRGAVPHAACAETGQVRQGARQAGPIREPCRTTSGGARLDGHARWPVATDRAQPPRPALTDGVTDDLPQWRLRLCTTRAVSRGPWAWRPPSRARQMADVVLGIVRQRTRSPARRQHGSKVIRDR